MTEYDHDKITIDKEDGEKYHSEKRAQEEYLKQLLKRISEDGETFEPVILVLGEEFDANGNRLKNVGEPENASDAARLADIDDVESETIEELENKTSGLSSDGSEATFDSLTTGSASIGEDTTTQDSLILEHPETNAQFEFEPDGTFSIDQLYTGGGNSELHYERVYREIWEDETINANISVSADRNFIIKIDSFRADISSSLYLRFDERDSEDYYYVSEDAETGDHIRETGATEFPLISDVGGSSGFSGRYEVGNTRSSRPSIIGGGTTRFIEAGEEILQHGSMDQSFYPDEINIYTDDTAEECEIEVLEPVPDASRPTDQWG